MIVLDTHVLVWLDADRAELGGEAARLIDDEFAHDGVAVSAISFWEIAMLVSKERLEVGKPLAQWRKELLSAGLKELPVDGGLGIEAVGLPGFHGDPADRLIVATTLMSGCRLLTADREILGWQGGLEALDARV